MNPNPKIEEHSPDAMSNAMSSTLVEPPDGTARDLIARGAGGRAHRGT